MGALTKIAWFFLIIILLIPVFFCVQQIGEQKGWAWAQSTIEEINVTGKLSFMNPGLNLLKAGANQAGDFLTDKLARIVGWKTLSGDLQCLNTPKYAKIGFFAAIWIFIVWLITYVSFGFSSLKYGFEYFWTGKYNASDWMRIVNPLDPKKKERLESFKDSFLAYFCRPGRLLLFIIIYTYIMAFFPFLNQIIKIITLEIFQPTWFVLSLIVAFEMVLAPSAIELYIKSRRRWKYYKEKWAEETTKAAQEAYFEKI